MFTSLVDGTVFKVTGTQLERVLNVIEAQVFGTARIGRIDMRTYLT